MYYDNRVLGLGNMFITTVDMSFSVLPLNMSCEDSVHSSSVKSHLLSQRLMGVQP